jgi:hypothetical protein
VHGSKTNPLNAVGATNSAYSFSADYNTVLKTIKAFLIEPYNAAIKVTEYSNYWSALKGNWNPTPRRDSSVGSELDSII